MDFLEACRRMIGTDSSPAAGTAEVGRFVEALAGEMGLVTELQPETWNGVDQANIIVRPPGSGSSETNERRPEFLLQTHLDTPDPGAYALWQKTGSNPFNASIYPTDDGDVIHGLGAADTKLDFLCKLFALKDLVDAGVGSQQSWRVPPVIVGTFGEELGMPGAVKLIRKKMVRPIAVLVGEPTAHRLVVAGKGFASVEIEIPFSKEEREFREAHNLSESASSQSRIFRGQAAHSSSPQLGESAIGKMLDALERLPNGVAVMEIEGGVNFNTVPAHAVLEIDLVAGLVEPMALKIVQIRQAIRAVESEFKNFADQQFVPAEPTMNIGMIRTFDDHVRISGCVRLPPTVAQAAYEGWMQRLRAACQGQGAEFRIGDYKPPFRTKEQADIIEICQNTLTDMGLSPELTAQSVANEANVYSKFSLDVVVWGPGQGVGNSHTPNECVKLSDLDAARDFYRRIMRRVSL
ncbi:MAG: M20/M25/M40 family metallo-hydrolase [Bdellovibrionales bacterium]|nr:M20/M25/M40 family metallo-hydrolase [Bdellovibrionales bacterium]